MRVSFVIPAHNAAATLGNALTSLQAQSVRSWEAVVVDDGSTDDTAAVAADWASRDRRVVLIQQPNLGASGARNAGLEVARYEWVTFLDADDWLSPHFLKHMLRPMRADPTLDGTFCNTVEVSEDGRHQEVYVPPERANFFPASARDCPIAIHGALVRRALVVSVGRFDPSLAVFDDWDLWQRLARSTARFATVARVLAFYRIRRGSLSRTHAELFVATALEVLRRVHREDVRVPNPDPTWANGYPNDDSARSACLFLACGAGMKAAFGCDASPLLDNVSLGPAHDPDPAALAHSLYGGFRWTAQHRTADWLRLWPDISQNVEGFLLKLEAQTGEPALAERIAGHLAEFFLCDADLNAPVTIGARHYVRLDVREPIPDVAVPPDVDSVTCRLELDGRRFGLVTLSASGALVSAARIAEAIIDERASPLLREYIAGRQSTQWRDVGRCMTGLILSKQTMRWLLNLLEVGPEARRDRLRAVFWMAARHVLARSRLLTTTDDRGTTGSLSLRPDRQRTLDEIEAADGERSHSKPQSTPISETPAHDRRACWNSIFADGDPWRYTSDYEQTKYRQTLDLLPARPLGRALEIGCAEGHFTAQLAQLVRQLTAVDISDVALERARRRCATLHHVDFRRFDMLQDEIPGNYDLIVCSEVLYFFRKRQKLKRFALQVARHLQPGGWLLMAHANLAAEDPGGTGFEWGHTIGSRSIGEIFSSIPSLRLAKELRTPLYRIHSFRKIENEPWNAAAEIVELPIRSKLNYFVASQISWNGRSKFKRTEVTDRLPVLMYHRIVPGEDGKLDRYRVTAVDLEQQLNYLQQKGYYGVDFTRWREAASRGHGLPGRAVLLTFDDGYQDFADHAWPLLQYYGFSATVFVVTDLVGRSAEWDRAVGEPAPLLSWAEIRRLAHEGVQFGSHSLDHPLLTTLPVQAIARQGALSRAALEQKLGRAVVSFAYPFGDHSRLVRRIMADCGYEVGLTCDGRSCQLADHRMALPRIEVTGFDDLSSFATKLGHSVRRRAVIRSIRAPLMAARERVRRWQAAALEDRA